MSTADGTEASQALEAFHGHSKPKQPKLEKERRGTGKWKQPGVPHKGWICIDSIDLLWPIEICQMCEVMHIRYVHYMQHEQYPSILPCGRICAGHMSEDLLGVTAREKTLKLIASRRDKWLSRIGWRDSFNHPGCHYINTDNFHISVWPNTSSSIGGFSAKVLYEPTRYTRYSSKYYAEMDEAKLAAFDVMEDMKKRMAAP